MSNISFADLPLVVRVMTCATMFMAWVMLAEFVIDRHGIDRYLPYYRVGNLCPYDLAVILLIAMFWFFAHKGT